MDNSVIQGLIMYCDKIVWFLYMWSMGTVSSIGINGLLACTANTLQCVNGMEWR